MKSAAQAALVVSLVLNGALTLLAWQATNYETESKTKIAKLESDVRSYSGKYLDLQERMDEQREAAEGKASMAVWELEQCRSEKNALPPLPKK